MAITQLPVALLVQLTLGTIVATALALLLASQIAELLIRFRANRLPEHLAQRYAEEWIAELRSMSNRVRMLTFAIAISVMRSRALTDAEEGLPGLHGAQVVLSVEDVRVYSDFWNRFAALTIDRILLWAISGAAYLVLSSILPNRAIALLFSTAWLLGVQVYCVRRFGGSPGKLLLKLRIVAMNGEPLTYRHALLRALPSYVLGTFDLLLGAWALSQIDPGVLPGLSRSAQSELILATIPIWIRWPFQLCEFGWGLGEIAVFIDSYEKRALHDLVAGTVVIYKIPQVVGSLSDNLPVGSTSAYR